MQIAEPSHALNATHIRAQATRYRLTRKAERANDLLAFHTRRTSSSKVRMWSYSNSTSPMPTGETHQISRLPNLIRQPILLTTQVASRVRLSKAFIGRLDNCVRVQQRRSSGLFHIRDESRRMTMCDGSSGNPFAWHGHYIEAHLAHFVRIMLRCESQFA